MVKLLYAGFDTFDIAFQGALPASVLEQLQAGRDEAETRQEKILIHFGPDVVEAHIMDHGKKGGFRFLIDTGPLGAVWMIKKNTDANQWNLFASPHATTLLAYGYQETFRRLLNELETMGARIVGHSINRADFAMDFETTGFELHPDQVVAHSHCKVSPYLGKRSTEEDEDQPQYVMRGRRVESVTIGKQPGRQTIIYDKWREAIERNKLHWFPVWGKQRNEKNVEVWRVEVRAGKRELKEKYRLSTMQDFERGIGDVIVNALNAIRYLGDCQLDSNVTRQALHPIWQVAQETAARNLSELRSGLTPNQVKEVERIKAQDTYLALCVGNAIGLAVSNGMSNQEIEIRLPEFLAEAITCHFRAKEPTLFAAIKRCRERLVFLS